MSAIPDSTAAQPHHNTETTMSDETTAVSETVSAGQLRAFIERIERLSEEKDTISEDISEVFAEMKGTGFDTKAVRSIIRLRKKDKAERQEEEAILDLYMSRPRHGVSSREPMRCLAGHPLRGRLT